MRRLLALLDLVACCSVLAKRRGSSRDASATRDSVSATTCLFSALGYFRNDLCFERALLISFNKTNELWESPIFLVFTMTAINRWYLPVMRTHLLRFYDADVPCGSFLAQSLLAHRFLNAVVAVVACRL